MNMPVGHRLWSDPIVCDSSEHLVILALVLASQALVEARALERAREAIEAGDWEGSYKAAKFRRAEGGAL